MSVSKIGISIDSAILAEVDALVARHEFASRSQAIQTAVREELARLKHRRLADECPKTDPAYEKQTAEEGM